MITRVWMMEEPKPPNSLFSGWRHLRLQWDLGISKVFTQWNRRWLSNDFWGEMDVVLQAEFENLSLTLGLHCPCLRWWTHPSGTVLFLGTLTLYWGASSLPVPEVAETHWLDSHLILSRVWGSGLRAGNWRTSDAPNHLSLCFKSLTGGFIWNYSLHQWYLSADNIESPGPDDLGYCFWILIKTFLYKLLNTERRYWGIPQNPKFSCSDQAETSLFIHSSTHTFWKEFRVGYQTHGCFWLSCLCFLYFPFQY